MNIFNIGVATEANDYEELDTLDEVWIKNDKGELVKLEDDENEAN